MLTRVLDNIQCDGPCSKKHPPENIVRCESGHPFCFEDVRQCTSSNLRSGALLLKCMNSHCNKLFPGAEVPELIDPNIFKLYNGYTKEQLETLIQNAGAKDLVEICPKCVSVIICGPVSQNSSISCTNPDCKLNLYSILNFGNRELMTLHCR